MKIRDRITELRRVKASELIPNPKNWRTHPQAQQDAMRGILAQVGYADAVLARETPQGLMLIDGHLRAEVTPDAEVPVLVLDVDKAEADLILATHDPLASMAGASEQELGELLAGVEVDSDALQMMLDQLAEDNDIDFGADELEVTEDAGPQMDRAMELQEQWGTESGQLWIIEGKQTHRLLCGDSTKVADVERVMGGELADCLLTDPPYGVSYIGKTKDALEVANDTLDEASLRELIGAVFSHSYESCRPGAYWYATVAAGPLHIIFADDWKRRGVLRQIMVWVKDSMVLGHSEYHYRHEPILFGWKPGDRHKNSDRTRTTVWEVARPKASREHPTMKPVELWAMAIRDGSRIDENVLEPKYVAVILQRMKDLGCEPRLAEQEAPQ